MDPIATVPFESDLQYILAEMNWIAARCRRLDIENHLRDVEDDPKPLPRTIGKGESMAAKEFRRRLPSLREAEDGLRTTIDARLALNHTDGPVIALDTIVSDHNLSAFERTILVLGCLPTLGHNYSDAFNALSSFGFAGNSLSVETVWAFMGMGGEERVKSWRVFLPTSPLLREGLVTLSLYGYGSFNPSALPGAIIELTSLAFSRIVGMPELATIPVGKGSENKGG